MPDAAADTNTNRDSGVVIRLGTPVAGDWIAGSAMMPMATNVRCPMGYLVIGARGILGYDSMDNAVLEGYTLDCAQLQTNGTLTGSMTSNTVGSTMAPVRTTTRSVSCGPNEASVLRDVRAGIVIDTVRLDCIALTPLLQTGTRTVNGTIDFTLLMGGSVQTGTCPANHVLVGLDAQQANYFGTNRVSGVRPVCAPIVISSM